MGIDIDTSDVRRLLEDPELFSDIAKAALEDSDAMDSLADDLADKMDDELENDPELKKQIIGLALSNASFKKKLFAKLVDNLG